MRVKHQQQVFWVIIDMNKMQHLVHENYYEAKEVLEALRKEISSNEKDESILRWFIWWLTLFRFCTFRIERKLFAVAFRKWKRSMRPSFKRFNNEEKWSVYKIKFMKTRYCYHVLMDIVRIKVLQFLWILCSYNYILYCIIYIIS